MGDVAQIQGMRPGTKTTFWNSKLFVESLKYFESQVLRALILDQSLRPYNPLHTCPIQIPIIQEFKNFNRCHNLMTGQDVCMTVSAKFENLKTLIISII